MATPPRESPRPSPGRRAISFQRRAPADAKGRPHSWAKPSVAKHWGGRAPDAAPVPHARLLANLQSTCLILPFRLAPRLLSGKVESDRRGMMRARDLMTPNPVTVAPQASIAEAWDLMRELEIRHIPVVARMVSSAC